MGAANIVAGSLWGTMHLAEVLKEAKEGIEFAIRSASLLKRGALGWLQA